MAGRTLRSAMLYWCGVYSIAVLPVSTYSQRFALATTSPTVMFGKQSTGSTPRVIPKQPADQFVREVLAHEVEAQLQDHSVWCFQETKLEAGKHKQYQICQTNEGSVERLVAIDGQTLSPERVQEEDRRIHSLVTDRGKMAGIRKKDHDDGEQARKMLKLFPQAFHFDYDGEVGNCVRLRFVPNPNFHPSNYSERVFHHTEGTMLLDPVQRRLAAIDGVLTSEVKFAGGLFCHLDKGGTFSVVQKNVGGQYWEVTSMNI